MDGYREKTREPEENINPALIQKYLIDKTQTGHARKRKQRSSALQLHCDVRFSYFPISTSLTCSCACVRSHIKILAFSFVNIFH